MLQVGYGHISPGTTNGKIFCILYSLIGIPLLLVFMTQVLQSKNYLIFTEICFTIRLETGWLSPSGGCTAGSCAGGAGPGGGTRSCPRGWTGGPRDSLSTRLARSATCPPTWSWSPSPSTSSSSSPSYLLEPWPLHPGRIGIP